MKFFPQEAVFPICVFHSLDIRMIGGGTDAGLQEGETEQAL